MSFADKLKALRDEQASRNTVAFFLVKHAAQIEAVVRMAELTCKLEAYNQDDELFVTLAALNKDCDV